jgi:ribose transport system ATP-binding protein
MATPTPVIELRGITKRFPGVVALDNVDLSLLPGEVHILLGENGSGKSTLAKITAGAYQPDDGTIQFRGNPVRIDSPRRALELGISTIYQEFTLLEEMSVMENIFLGREPLVRGSRGMLIDRKAMRRRTAELLTSLSVSIDPETPISHLGVAQKQLVEITKALSLSNEGVLLMDEPTSALSSREIDELFRVIREFTARGVAVLYISHRLEEIERIGDRVTVLRDGKKVGDLPASEARVEKVINMMVGRSMSEMFPKRAVAIGAPILEVNNLTVPGKAEDISFKLHAGEIVGLFGLVGAGRTELIRGLMRLAPISQGAIRIRGKSAMPASSNEAIRFGLGMVPEERRSQGIFPLLSVADNIVISALNKCTRWFFTDFNAQKRAANHFISGLRIRTPTANTEIYKLSGGNQQKAILARLLFADTQIVLLDEPTRGIDVGAKYEVYQLIIELAASGKAILFVSSDLPEILGMSDRVLVMSRGRLVADTPRSETTPEGVLQAAFASGMANGGTVEAGRPGHA